MKTIWWLLLFLWLAVGGVQRSMASGNDVLKIGVLLPPDEPQLQSVREGILLAQEQANRDTNGPVHVSIRGRVGQWGADAVEAARLVTDEEAAGLITPPDGSASHLVLQVSGRTAVPVITLCADSSVGRTGVPWLLRMVPRTEDEALALFKGVFPAGSGRDRRWMAFVPGQRSGREIGHDLRKAALACDCTLDPVLEVTSLTNSDQSVTRALRSRPEAVLIWLPPELAAGVIRNLRSSNYTGPLCGPSRLQGTECLAIAGSAAEGFIIPALVCDSGTGARQKSFAAAYEEHWHHSPDAMAAMSYDTALLLVSLLRQEEFLRPPHRLPAAFSCSGVTGEVSFDAEGNRKVQLELLRARGGRFVRSD